MASSHKKYAQKKDNHTLGRDYLKKIPDNAEAVAGVISERGSRGTPSPFNQAYSLGAKCQFPGGASAVARMFAGGMRLFPQRESMVLLISRDA